MKATRQSVLAGLIERHNWTRGAELGVWQGATFGYLLDAFPRLQLIGVDNWRAAGPYAGKDMATAESMARAIAARHHARSELIKGDTCGEVTDYIADASLDFVFIDASHDFNSVRDDIDAWRLKVKKGGALTGHDANLTSVSDVLDLDCPGWARLPANVWYWGVP